MRRSASVGSCSDEALHLFEEPGCLRHANEATIEFMQSHPMVVNWGDLGDCAADAMGLDPSRHIWLAHTDPKHRTFSTATYVHTLTPRLLRYSWAFDLWHHVRDSKGSIYVRACEVSKIGG